MLGLGTALRWAWSLVSPWLGPLVTRVAPWLVPWVSGLSLRRIARGLGLAALLTFVAWGVWRFSRPDPDAPVMVSVDAVEASRLKAENAELKAANARSQETLRQRERGEVLANQLILSLEAEKEALRALSSDPDAPVFAHDDPWLLERRR